MFRWLVVAAAAAGLSACATQYGQEGFTGGFDIKDLGQDVYRMSFSGNGYTSRETVQTYWLYKSAEFALERGYTGFEILSDISFVMRQPAPEDVISPAFGGMPANGSLPASPNEVANLPAGRSETRNKASDAADSPVRVAHAAPVFIYGGGGVAKPWIEADVHFLRRPVESTPPKLFNARLLKARLDPIIRAEKCNVGNVCPHVHEYLLPTGKLR
jgi:hypothetical protein